jgi:hypothetical protein
MDLLKKIETPFQEAVLLVFFGFTAWLMLGGISFFLNTTPSTFIYFGEWGYQLISKMAHFFGYSYFLFPLVIFKVGRLIISKSTGFGELFAIWKRVTSNTIAGIGLAVAIAALLHVFSIHLKWSPEAKLLEGHGGFLGMFLGGHLYTTFGFSGALLAIASCLSLIAIFTGGFSIVSVLISIEELSINAFKFSAKSIKFAYNFFISLTASAIHFVSIKLGLSKPEEQPIITDALLEEQTILSETSSEYHPISERMAVGSPQNFWNQAVRYANAATVFDGSVITPSSSAPAEAGQVRERSLKVVRPRAAEPIDENVESVPAVSAEPSLSPEPDSKLNLKIEAWKKAYSKPPKSLLKLSKKAPVISASAKKEQIDAVERCLAGFGLDGKVVAVHNGVRLSMFEFEPAIGVKISKIQALSNDLALSLGANSLRILAPIPGKNTVGIEIPSKNPSALSLGDLMDATQKNKSAILPFALGKDVYGDVLIEDLSAMPHLLVSGTTGSGKSVFTNGLISSLLFNMSPRDLRFIMIDPKMIELTPYNGIPHLLKPVISDVEEAKESLVWAEQEMDRRYQMFLDVGARNIESFNQKIKDISPKTLAKKLGKDASYSLEHMPYIVIVIDELADLMITQGKEVERPITRIAQKARACGIHLVLATQRPSAEIVTGLIKTNFPSRISFKVSSSIDSRTILDVSGGEKLLGQGDMLYLPNGRNIIRVQGAYLSEEEVSRLVKYIKED